MHLADTVKIIGAAAPRCTDTDMSSYHTHVHTIQHKASRLSFHQC